MDAVVAHAGVALSVRDLGGSGAPVLLLHGAGNTLADMVPLATHLAADHRVVAMDLRNHGHSGDGRWEWDEVLGDVHAVISQLELVRPVVVGHSLGGMLAALYADRYADVAAAVNLDGHPDGTAADTAPDVARLRELLRTYGDLTIRELSRPRTGQEIGVARDGWLAGARALGLDGAMAAEAFDRRLVGSDETGFTSRPVAARLSQLRDAVEGLDLLACYRRASVPQLVYIAMREATDPNLTEELRGLAAAYRQRLVEQLRHISTTVSHVRLVELDATHGLIYECPQLLADQIREFVKDVA